MDGWHLALFLAATYFGGLTSGLSGFAMGLVVSGVWLHLVSPQQNALLIVLCGLVTQGSGIWRVRHAISWRTVAPYIVGGAIGIPAGIALLTSVDPGTLRLTIGVLLLVYSLYSLFRPALTLVLRLPEGEPRRLIGARRDHIVGLGFHPYSSDESNARPASIASASFRNCPASFPASSPTMASASSR